MEKFIHLEETKSTSSYLAAIAAEAANGTVVYADRQTAGRGQRGNSWESMPYKNITMSILLKQGNVAPANQFQLSEACALAVVRTLEKYVGQTSIKWPNDIYYGDKKICGMLIEHSLSGGRINHTIAGIGINVNQPEFYSDAPNPVSIKMITGKDNDLDAILKELASNILQLCSNLPGKADEQHRDFLLKLYRREGFHPYRAKKDTVSTDGKEKIAAGELFSAAIDDVEPDGMLLLSTESGAIHRFAFKEVEFVIK